MQWTEDHVEKLTSLYVKYDVTSDNLIKDKELLTKFSNDFNSQASTSFTDEEIAQKLFNLRKSKKLPTIRS